MPYCPWTGRKFGVEMELNSTTVESVHLGQATITTAVRNALTAIGSRHEARQGGYFRSNGQSWDIKTDASCGWEVASPALMLNEAGDNAELKAVTEKLASLQPRIDRSCGLHVHVEVLDFDWRDLRNLVALWARYEPFVFELCPPSRRTNQTYCAPIRKSMWDAPDAGHWTRFESILNTNTQAAVQGMPQPRGALNLAHFWPSHRIEFRLGAGTVQYEKIARWVQFLLSFVGRVKQTNMPMIQTGQWSNRGFSTTYVAKMLGLAPSRYVPETEITDASRKLVEWIDRRRTQFQRPGVSDEERTIAGGTTRGR
jgi:hypothetical protein